MLLRVCAGCLIALIVLSDSAASVCDLTLCAPPAGAAITQPIRARLPLASFAQPVTSHALLLVRSSSRVKVVAAEFHSPAPAAVTPKRLLHHGTLRLMQIEASFASPLRL